MSRKGSKVTIQHRPSNPSVTALDAELMPEPKLVQTKIPSKTLSPDTGGAAEPHRGSGSGNQLMVPGSVTSDSSDLQG